MVYLTVTLLYEGMTVHDLSGRCSGSKPIIEFIRPKIQRTFGGELLHLRQSRLVIAMYSSGDRDWSSPAKLFQVGRTDFNNEREKISAKANPVWIRSPYPARESGCGRLPKLNGRFLFQGYTCDKIFVNISSVFSEI